MPTPPAAQAAPIASRPSQLDFSPFVGRHPSQTPPIVFPVPEWEPGEDDDEFDQVADKLAWRNDSDDNEDENYPGGNWSSEADDEPPFEPTAADLAELRAAMGNDHDGRFCPTDIENWSISEDDYQSAACEGEGDDWFARVHPAELAEMGWTACDRSHR